MKDRWYKYNRGTDQEQTNNRSKLQKVYMKNSACLWLPNMQNMGKLDKPDSCWVAKCEETQGKCTSYKNWKEKDQGLLCQCNCRSQQQQLLLQVVVVSNSCWKPSTVLLLKLKGFGLVHKGEPRVL
jgi:hypothetical protein